MPRSSLDRAPARRASAVIEALLVSGVLVAASQLPAPAPPSYVAHASVLVLPPALPSRSNPFSGLTGVSDVLVHAMTTRAAHARLRAEGVTGSYRIVSEPDSAGPVLRVTVSDRGQTETSTELRRVIAQLRTTLMRLQSAAGTSSSGPTVHILVLELPGRATPVSWTTRIFGGHI